ncbi:UDP-N-acetylglucosamine 4,6-dehydratase (inverting) [Dongia rigui]|uniref:UDP-N-acetylglucosamine 4,6-dehydratase (Inverting) n=1 Tax=Dongia rigui TaxID=940149 RepID=A0ABU5E2M5_9PROT|nr:UDP-N-acetylglucosamine 4,6-dehydratase (inverting) [Dongia rigui]MDY0873627.1 UDP-N-acetylglucosamine 4,6-dehydratase (inverting) [Dongia rigui]
MFETALPDLNGKSILVTGGTGSFGKAFIRRILQDWKPKRLIVFSRDELKQWEMQQELSTETYPAMRYFIGDVRDAQRLEMATRDVDYIIHAAALKQVPAAEYNPFECIHTNVIGAENVVQAAIKNRVKRVVALSTDKAANPVNLYGASKLASDKIFIAANALSGGHDPIFAVVRYGNVIGSRGSVVPVFQDMVKKGAKTIPITDDRMTRFWITLDQGVAFVLSSMQIMRGGEIFVPKIPSMKVTDLANCLAPGIPHSIVGIRPGEKLHEVMITEDDSRSTVELEDRYVIEPVFTFWSRRSFAQDGAAKVAEGFRFASDINTAWLDGAALKKML